MALRGAVVFGRQRPGQVPLSPSQGTRVSERRIVSVVVSGLGAADPASLNLWGAMGEQWMGSCLGCFLQPTAVVEYADCLLS